MTDTQKIIEEQLNQAWARGTNWAMQGRGYALDTNADTQAEVLIELFRNIQEEARAEERERVRVEIEKMEGITKNLSFGPKIIKELKGYQASYGIEDRALAEIAGIVKDRVLSDLLDTLKADPSVDRKII